MFTTAESLFPLLAIYLAVAATAALLLRIPWFASAEQEAGIARLQPLDGLRGILCFGVFAHHAAMTMQQTWYTGAWRPPEAAVYDVAGKGSVALFFCITGFLFWGRLLRRQGTMDRFDFYRGRVLRIVPLYAVSALICLIVVAASPMFHLVSWARVMRLVAEMGTLGVAPWTRIETAAGNIYPDTANAGVVWSLRYEWVFYFALPVLALFARGRRWILLYVGWVLGLAVFFRQAEAPKVLMFAVGMIAAHVQANKGLCAKLRERKFALLSISFVGVTFLLAVPHGHVPALTRSPFSSTSNLLLAGVFIPIACGNSLFGLLNIASLRFLGTVSYSVYLLHGTILYFSKGSLARFVEPPTSFNVQYWLAVTGVAIVVAIASAISYRLIELPFIELAQRLRHRAAQPAPTAPLADAGQQPA